jgi:hypothetical protein
MNRLKVIGDTLINIKRLEAEVSIIVVLIIGFMKHYLLILYLILERVAVTDKTRRDFQTANINDQMNTRAGVYAVSSQLLF